MSAPQPIDRVPSTQFTPEAQRQIGFFGPVIPVHVAETVEVSKKVLLADTSLKLTQARQEISPLAPLSEIKRSTSFNEAEILFP